MTTPWRRAQDRKRTLVAAASTGGIYVLAFAVVWAAGLLSPGHLSDHPGVIIVDLGGTEGASGDIPLGLPNAPDRPPDAEPGAAPLPAQATEEPPPPPQESAAKATIPAPAPVKTAPAPVKTAPAHKPAAPKTAPKTAKTIPDAAAKTEEVPAGPTAEEIAAQKAYEEALAKANAAASAAAAARSTGTTSTKKFGSGSPGSPVASGGGTGTTPGVAGGTGTVTYKGIEMGNALSTTFGASEGDVGRNLYVPIYTFMPLPEHVDDAVYQKVGAKSAFEAIYQKTGTSWTLKAPVPIAQRDSYWKILEDAGYDPAKAEYKAGKKLKPVKLEYAVGPVPKGAKSAELIDVRLVSSSGSKEIDEAVLFGFKQSAFFNKTGNAVSGTFVYSFD